MVSPSIPRLRILLPLLGIAAAIAAMLPVPQPAQAQLGDVGLWPTITRVSTTAFASLEPDVAYDGDGFAHAVYYGGPTQDGWAIYYTNNRSGVYAAPRLISEASGEQRSPDIVVGNDGHVHVLYEKRKTADVMYVGSPNLGLTWGEPESLTPTGAKAYEAALAVDANNTVHAVWCDRRWTGKQTITYSARPANGNWTAPGPIGINNFDRWPGITTTGTGANVRVHVVYQTREPDSDFNPDFEIGYITSSGSRFLPPKNISNDSGIWSLEPAITSNGVNELYVVWDIQNRDSHDIALIRSTDLGTNWTDRRVLNERPNTAVTPSISFGNSGGIPRVHVGWDEDNSALYLLYEPSENSFGDTIELVSNQRESKEVDVAASNVSDEVAVSYQAREGTRFQAYVGTKGAGTLVTAIPSINDGAAYTTSRNVTIKLANVRGNPTQMRYSWTLGPENSPWVPFQATFNSTIPFHPFCEQRFYIQLRAADGRTSPLLARAIILDDAIQAQVTMRNPYLNGNDSSFLPLASIQDAASTLASEGHEAYTRRDFFYSQITNTGECSSLTRFYVGKSTSPWPLTNSGFVNVLPLPGSPNDGPREVTIAVEDSLGNRQVFSQTITLDRKPPTLAGGDVAIQAPQDGLPTVLADLAFSNVQVDDDYYPEGRWGVWITNVTNPAVQDDDVSLSWQPVQIQQQGASFVVEDWNILNGITSDIDDRSLAGKSIQVRVKFLDGAGNASSQTLNTTVVLAPNFQPDTSYLPTVLR